MRSIKKTAIFDAVVIVLGLSYGISILSQVLYLPALGMVIPLCLFFVISHLVRFGVRFPIFRRAQSVPIFVLFFSILLLDLFQALLNINDGGNVANAAARVVYQFVFFSYLYNVYSERGFDYLIRPYIGYSLYNVIAIMLMASLILAGVSWTHNPLDENVQILVDDINGRTDNFYYLPYYISIVAEYHQYSVIPNLPGITGLSHEPHVIMWVITPPLIMRLAYKYKAIWKYFFALAFVFILIETFSTMAIICIIPIVLFHILWRGRYTGNIISAVLIVLAVFVFALVSYFAFEDEIRIITEVMSLKASKGEDSYDFSTTMFGYITSFDSLFGYGNLPSATGDVNEAVLGHQSAGIVTGVLDIVLFISLLFKSLKLSLSMNKSRHFIGLGGLYLLIHGLKVNYFLFGYPMLPFFLLIIWAASRSREQCIGEAQERTLF